MPRLCGRVDSDRIPRTVMLRTRDKKKQMSVARYLLNVGEGIVLRTGGEGREDKLQPPAGRGDAGSMGKNLR